MFFTWDQITEMVILYSEYSDKANAINKLAR